VAPSDDDSHVVASSASVPATGKCGLVQQNTRVYELHK